jgi:hypothetical protein
MEESDLRRFFLKGPFGCWRMGTDEGGGGRQKEEVESSQPLASAAAFERKTSPRGNILPLWTSKYPPTPRSPRSGIPNGTSHADSHSRPHRSPTPTRSKTPPPLPTLKRRCRSRIFRAQRTTMANQTVSASVSPRSTTNALGTSFCCCEVRESDGGQDGNEG